MGVDEGAGTSTGGSVRVGLKRVLATITDEAIRNSRGSSKCLDDSRDMVGDSA